MAFAVTVMTGTTAAWGCTKVAVSSTTTTWTDFEDSVEAEFFPADCSKRSRDKLRKPINRTSVSYYLSELLNIV